MSLTTDFLYSAFRKYLEKQVFYMANGTQIFSMKRFLPDIDISHITILSGQLFRRLYENITFILVSNESHFKHDN